MIAETTAAAASANPLSAFGSAEGKAFGAGYTTVQYPSSDDSGKSRQSDYTQMEQESCFAGEAEYVITYDANGGGFFEIGSEQTQEDTQTEPVLNAEGDVQEEAAAQAEENGDTIYSETVPEGTVIFNEKPDNLVAYTGCQFRGWSFGRSDSEMISEEGFLPEADTILYAIWDRAEEENGEQNGFENTETAETADSAENTNETDDMHLNPDEDADSDSEDLNSNKEADLDSDSEDLNSSTGSDLYSGSDLY